MLGKARRATARLVGQVAARRSSRPQVWQPATGLSYVRVRRAGTVRSLRRQWRWARWTASSNNPALLILAPGIYPVNLLGIDGLAVVGAESTLTSASGRDTLEVGGCSMLLQGLTVEHVGDHYAIHADAPGEGAELVLVDVVARSKVKAGIGLGLFGGQAVRATRCRFVGGWTGVHAHTWVDQAAPAVFSFTECEATGEVQPVSFRDLGSRQPDVWSWNDEKPPAPGEGDGRRATL